MRGHFAKGEFCADRTEGLDDEDIIDIAYITKFTPPGDTIAEDLLLRRLGGRRTRKDPPQTPQSSSP